MADILQMCVRYPPAPGGAETHVRSISEGLREKGHEVKVYTSDLYQEFPFKRLEEGAAGEEWVKRHRAYTLGGDMHYLFYPSLLSSLAREDFDLYHAHSYGYFHVNSAAFFKHLKDTPFVLTPHFHPEWSMWGGRKRKLIRGAYDSLIAQKVIDSTDRIIGVSRNEIDLLRERLDVPSEKVRIVPNGIDPDEFTPVPDGEKFRDEYDLDGDMVLYTGRLASNKGLLDLVESVPMILEEHPDTTFVLVGEDEGMRGKIEKKARKLGVQDDIRILGYIEDYGLFKSAYSAADVFVLPSEYEAFGIVLLEAMMCETPCVGTDVGGVPEVIEDSETGIVVPSGSPKKLSKSIDQLLAKPDIRKKMGEKGRKRVLENFTWEEVVKSIDEIYEELI